MKIIKLKEISLPPGAEYSAGSYSGNGVYLVNNRQVISVLNGMCMYIGIDSLMIEELEALKEFHATGSVSEHFVFALIEKTVELVKMQPSRQIRSTDIQERVLNKE